VVAPRIIHRTKLEESFESVIKFSDGKDSYTPPACKRVKDTRVKEKRVKEKRVKVKRVKEKSVTEKRVKEKSVTEKRVEYTRVKEKRVKDTRVKEKRVTLTHRLVNAIEPVNHHGVSVPPRLVHHR